MMWARAARPRFLVKKIQLQIPLRASWTRKRERATPLERKPPERQTSHAAMAIMKYNVVQIGPNSHDGGAQAGWIS